jgi:DNA-binding LacI/PurR family transcriptional regulator
MHDVAVAAGVSSQTVSRVANGGELVRPETRKKVIDAMHQMGYRPNFAARALKRGQFKAIGVALFDILSTGNIRALEGITREASARGYATTLTMLNKKTTKSLAEAVERMKTLPIDGIIVILEKMLPDITTYVPADDLPVTIITSAKTTTMSTIDEDQYRCSFLVVDYFLERGHKNVHFISGPRDSVASQFRLQGWKDALAEHGITPPRHFVGDWTADSGYEAGKALAQMDECTAIYAGNDFMANGAIQALEDAGKKVPEDVSVIGVDDSLKDVIPSLTLTSVRLDFTSVGRRALAETVRAIESEDILHPTRVLLPGKVIERSSVSTLNGSES